MANVNIRTQTPWSTTQSIYIIRALPLPISLQLQETSSDELWKLLAHPCD